MSDVTEPIYIEAVPIRIEISFGDWPSFFIGFFVAVGLWLLIKLCRFAFIKGYYGKNEDNEK